MLRTRKFWCFAAVAAAVTLAASHAEAGWRHRGGSWGSSGGSWGSSGGSWGSSGGSWCSSGGSWGRNGGSWGSGGGSWGSYGGYNRGSWGYSASWVGGSWGSHGGHNGHYGHAYRGPAHNGWKVVSPEDAQTKPPTRVNGNGNGGSTPPPPPANGGSEPPMTNGTTPLPPATQPAIPPLEQPGDTDLPGFDTPPPATTPGDTTPPPAGGVVDPFGARQVSTSALIAVDVPEQATVTINGRPTTSKGEEREYVSRGLKPGYAYQYEIAVDLGELNANQILTRTVQLRAGEKVILTFEYEQMEGEDEQAYNEPMGDEATDTTMSLIVPADAKVFLAGRPTTSTGTHREYATSKLAPGQSWDDYTIRVTVERDGQTLAKEKTLNLVGGKHVDLTFDFEAPQVAKAAR